MKKIIAIAAAAAVVIGVAAPASADGQNYYGPSIVNQSGDVDCASIGTWVYVARTDVHLLDRDRNRIGCEPWNDGDSIAWKPSDSLRLLGYARPAAIAAACKQAKSDGFADTAAVLNRAAKSQFDQTFAARKVKIGDLKFQTVTPAATRNYLRKACL